MPERAARGRADQRAQALNALERANEIRAARSELKRRIADGELRASAVIVRPPAEAARMPVDELLISQRSWGRVRARRLLSSLRIREGKALGTLTDRQRHALVDALTDQ